jgi:hypothetical protein
MSVARLPQLGSKPVALTVKLPAASTTEEVLTPGLQALYRTGEFTDVAFVCAGQRFVAHRTVLACQSAVLKENLSMVSSIGSHIEVKIDISNPEAVKFMLDHLYQLDDSEWAKYNPRTQEINRDVLRLAHQFQLPGLTQRAMTWMAKDLTTGNVVERLSICEEFQLNELSDKILEQLTNNRQALAEVANSPQIMTYPRLMQAMLQCAAGAPEPPEAHAAQMPKGKKARKV